MCGMLHIFILAHFCKGEVLTASRNFFSFIFRISSRGTSGSRCQGLHLRVGSEARRRKTPPSSFHEVLELDNEKFNSKLPRLDGLEVQLFL